MVTVDYSEILDGTASLCGMPDELAPEDFGLLRNFHNRRLQRAWEIETWPDVCRTEQRWFAPFFDGNGDATYELGDFVFYPGTGIYYQALQSNDGSDEPVDGSGNLNGAWWALAKAYYQGDDWASSTAYVVGRIVRKVADGLFYQCITAHTSGGSFDGTKFAVLTPFARKIVRAQTGFTAIEELFNATDLDPRVTTQLRVYPTELYEDGWYFTRVPGNVPYVWIQYRVKRPHLIGKAWDAEVEYGTGRQVYFKDEDTDRGNFFTATSDTVAGESPESAPSKWTVVEVPMIFEGYLKQAGFADWLRQEPERSEEAPGNEVMAEEFLELEADKLRRQQGQMKRFSMVN